jgi:hypothetical protein
MIGLTLAAVPLHAADPDVATLLARLARPAPDSTSFVEVRYSSLLAKPIVVSGHLEHREDGSLVRRVEWPYQEVTELQGENVSVERTGSKPRRFTLDRAPELRGMLASLDAILQGDRQLLDRYFAVTAQGSDSRWEITLTPRDDKLKRRLSRIVGTGLTTVRSAYARRAGWRREPDGARRGRSGGAASVARPGRAHAWCTDGNRHEPMTRAAEACCRRLIATVAILGWIVDRHRDRDRPETVQALPQTPQERLILEEIGEGPASRMLLLAISGPDPQAAADTSRALAAALRASGEFRLVANGESSLDAIPDSLLAYRYLLMTLDHSALDAGFLRAARGART